MVDDTNTAEELRIGQPLNREIVADDGIWGGWSKNVSIDTQRMD